MAPALENLCHAISQALDDDGVPTNIRAALFTLVNELRNELPLSCCAKIEAVEVRAVLPAVLSLLESAPHRSNDPQS
jgi:uncharacterized protein (UPF0147 family)